MFTLTVSDLYGYVKDTKWVNLNKIIPITICNGPIQSLRLDMLTINAACSRLCLVFLMSSTVRAFTTRFKNSWILSILNLYLIEQLFFKDQNVIWIWSQDLLIVSQRPNLNVRLSKSWNYLQPCLLVLFEYCSFIRDVLDLPNFVPDSCAPWLVLQWSHSHLLDAKQSNVSKSGHPWHVTYNCISCSKGDARNTCHVTSNQLLL